MVAEAETATAATTPTPTPTAAASSSSTGLAPPAEKLRVAIIGTGLAGITTAYLLSTFSSQHDVHIFERANSLGMDAGSISVDLESGVELNGQKVDNATADRVVAAAAPAEGDTAMRIDVPARVIHPGYYPNLHALYRHLEVPLAPADYTLSFSAIDSDSSTLEPASLFSYTTVTLPGGYRIKLPSFVAPSKEERARQATLYADWLRFMTHVIRHTSLPVRRQRLVHMRGSIREYLVANAFSTAYISEIMEPLMASIATCSYDSVGSIPASIVFDYVARTFSIGRNLKAACGIQEICTRLTRNVPTENIHLGVNVAAVYETERGSSSSSPSSSPSLVVELTRNNGGSGSASATKTEKLYFDRVIMAVNAHQAREMLIAGNTRPGASSLDTPVQRKLMSALDAIPFDTTTVVTHTDTSVMPADQSKWRGINIGVIPPARDVRPVSSSASPISLSKLSRSSPSPSPSALSPSLSADSTVLSPSPLRQVSDIDDHDSDDDDDDDDDDDSTSGSGSGGVLSKHHQWHQVSGDPNQPMASIWINRAAMGSGFRLKIQLFQTVNPLVSIDPSKVLTSASFTRSLITEQSLAALDVIHDCQGERDIYFVGSYTCPGIPLLEGCVFTSYRVAEAFDVHIPFDYPKRIIPPGQLVRRFFDDPSSVHYLHYLEQRSASPTNGNSSIPSNNLGWEARLLRVERVHALDRLIAAGVDLVFAIVDMAAAIMDAVGALLGYDVGSSSSSDGGIPFSVYMWNSFIALLVFLIVRISPDKR